MESTFSTLLRTGKIVEFLVQYSLLEQVSECVGQIRITIRGACFRRTREVDGVLLRKQHQINPSAQDLHEIPAITILIVAL